MNNRQEIAKHSYITFRTDIGRTDAKEIRLGGIVEIYVPYASELRVLGLVGRTQLTPSELDDVGRLSKANLENPFRLLEREFYWAWENTSPGRALDELSARHEYSLAFSRPKPLALPDGFASEDPARDARRFVFAEMERIEEGLIQDHIQHMPIERDFKEIKRAAA